MSMLFSAYRDLADRLERADYILPIMARFLFAAILLMYFWKSGLTKLGDGISGIWLPGVGAYAQIFPKTMEAVTYDVTQLGLYHWAVVLLGTWAEFLLPLMIVVGLACRFASLGMIGFVVVQSLTDLYGHAGFENGTLGAWFDKAPDGIILDQRALWVFLLLVLVMKGAGPLSLDRLLSRSTPQA